MTNDWQEKHIFVYLVDFVQVLLRANFVGGAFEDFGVWKKNWNKPSAFVKHW